jgi:hypothetical protein
VDHTIGVYSSVFGAFYLRNENSPGVPDAGAFFFGLPGWIGVSGDWNGDGLTSVGVVDPSSETWYLRNENSAGAPDAGVFQFGLPGWIPLTGDWNGSGETGIGVYDPSTATFYLKNTAGPGAADFVFQFGMPGWLPVTGDWDGNGTTTVGVVNPSTTSFYVWYLRNENSSGPADAGVFQFGGTGGVDVTGQWKPVTGDWNASGHTEVGIVNPQGYWFIAGTATTPNATPPLLTLAFPYGGTGPTWLPLSGDWDYPANPQLAAGGRQTPASADLLSQSTLQTVVSAALQRVEDAGASDALVSQLASATYTVADLPGVNLGLTDAATGQVWISADAAGYGWFTDASAASDSLFDSQGYALPGSAAAGKMDLLTVVLHEMGHLAGLPDLSNLTNPNSLMAESLGTGTRRVDALDAIFSGK